MRHHSPPPIKFTTDAALLRGMGELVAWIYDRTKRVRWLWVVALFAVVGVSLLSASRARFSQDLFDALPHERALDGYRALLDAAGSSGRMVVGFRAEGTTDIDSLTVSAQRFVEVIRTDLPDLVDSVFFEPDPAGFQLAVSDVLKNLPLYADSARLQQVAGMDSLALQKVVADLRNELTRPGAELDAERMAMDPLGLAAPVLARTMASAELAGVQLINGGLFSQDSSMAIVVLSPNAAAAENGEGLMRKVNDAIAQSKAIGTTGAAFGGVPMAVANAERIGKDAKATSIVALVLIIGLLIWRYRSIRVPLLFLVPPAVGFTIGLGAIATVRPVISALSLGASAALLGIALDYCFHFFTHLRHTGNVRATLKDVAGPMLLGCFTTALAFAALSFVGSRILADLGFIAAFMLIGAALTVLLVLPHFSVVPERSMVEESPSVERKRGGAFWRLTFLLVVTVALVPFISKVSYDNDPEHLSWISAPMQAVRNTLEGDTARAVPVFWAGAGASEEEARQALERAVDKLRKDPGADPMLKGAMPIDLWPSQQRAEERIASWRSVFPQGESDRFANWFRGAAVSNGFTADAFDPFLRQLEVSVVPQPTEAVRAVSGEVVARVNNEVIVAGRLMVPPHAIAGLEKTVRGDPASVVLHRGMLNERIQQLVGSDLSNILWRTSIIVFLALLITYGRIELTLLTFLPMALGWVWILGICGLFGIQFDLVNILVCTFVFGLGDDYCIFTTEGLLERYRTGTDNSRSFRDAVILSGITTIVGTGVLLFAQHPALRSIAVLSVTGMVVLLTISLTVQPVLFRLFIGDRAASGRQPFTLFSFLISAFAFLYFLLGCILLSLYWLVLLVIPAPKPMKQQWLRNLVRLFTGSLVYVMANTKKDIEGFRKVIVDRPSIVIANHASFVDILTMLMISPKVVMMTNRWVWNSPFFGRVVRYAGYLRTEDGVEVNTERAREAMAQGLSVIIFPEGTRSIDGAIGRFHKGAFHIAEALQVPIVPVVLHGIGTAMSKNDALLKNALISMRTLPSIEPGDPRFGTGDRERTKKIATWYKEEYEAIRSMRETPKWFHEKLVRNFMYKGPVLEWYTRIKSQMDVALHELLHARIPLDARVVDLGSGHGMVSLLLGWSAKDRTVQGFERDAEKVAIAEHAFGKGPRINFSVADLEHLAPPPADAYILKDVLHYLTMAKQRELLLACANGLSPEGAIFVRDGFASNDERHERTKWTERLSIGLGFNMAKGELDFMKKETIAAIAEEAGLRVEWALREARTSNELVILHKGK